ncbi:insulin-like growth factor binding protein [Anaeramoeba flamelloides]|uniref:Insulin-like growth factor binding protein n=1 Tax=Anaeramoeba flamelloides TaxID=1746091 RepID=A0ABQ8ZBX2_9EUKA|nr:insulin-like growth factor binding protein [Anaeramoeba flamelloides]
MKIPNANLSNLRALNKLKSKTHYFHGSNKTNWKTDLANYAMIQYSNIFEGVDLQFETTTTQTQTQKKQGFDATLHDETKIKSSFYLSQAKELSKIQWQFQTSNNLEIRIPKDKGTLQFVSKLTKEIILEESKPIFFQNNLELQGQFILKNHQEKKEHQVQHDRENTVSFLINDPNFQPNNHLIIDPTYSTFFAGDYTDEAQDFVIDSQGNFIGVGTTMSRNFPADGDLVYIEGQEGAYRDVLVFKLSPDCDLIWSGYLSSIIDDRAITVIVDSKDDMYLGGYTEHYEVNKTTSNFPTTEGAYRMDCVKNNQGTPFITKLSKDGDLINSTVICGEGFDQITNLALSSDESILYFLGGGNSDKFPTDDQNGETIHCVVNTNNNFYGIMDSQLSNLSYCKCFEAGEEDDPDQISVTRIHFLDNYLYFGGSIQGHEDKLIQHENCTYQRSTNPPANKYFLYGRFNKDDLSIDYVCFYGGSNGDEGFKDMKFDSEGNIWIVGSATSSDLVTSEGALFPHKSPVSTENGAIMKFKEKDCLYASYYYNNENDNNCFIASIDLGDQDQIIIYAQDYRPLEQQYDYIYGDNSAIQIFNKDFNETFLTISVPALVSPKTSFNNKNIYTLFFSGYSNINFLTYTTQNAWQDQPQGDYDIQIIKFQWDCGSGNSTTREGCVPCPKGTYNDEIYIAHECNKCLGGTYQDEEGQSICKECDYGTFQNGKGNTVCRVCEKGTFTNEKKSTQCHDCAIGTYSDIQGLSKCLDCGPGLYSAKTKSTFCDQCSKGKFSNKTSNTECRECHFGTYSNLQESIECKKCSVGSYQNATGKTKCEYCANGSFTKAKGYENCIKCSPGTYQPNVRSKECLQCEKGFYQDDEGATECKLCQGGKISNKMGQLFCDPCESGTYSNEIRTECLKCPRGTYNNKTGVSSIDMCEACPLLTYGPIVGSKSIDGCIPCKEGYWSETIGGISESVCIPCSKGTFLDPKQTEMGCQTCQLGSYSDQEAMTACILCPEGTTHSKNFQKYVDCQSGTYAQGEGNTKCHKCSNGYYNNKTKQASCIKCVHPEYCLGEDKCSYGRDPDTVCEISKKSNFNKHWSDRFGWIFLNYKSNRYWFELFEITIKFILALSAIIFLNDEKGIEQRNYFLLGLFVVALMIMIYLRPYQMDLTFENNGKFAAEDKAQIGLYLMLIGAITLVLGFLKSILFLILWPLGAIIGVVGLYHSYQKKLERKSQQRVKFNLNKQLNKQDKQLKKFSGKETFDDLKLLSLNQKIYESLQETCLLKKKILYQIEKYDHKIEILNENHKDLLNEKNILIKNYNQKKLSNGENFN